MSYLALACDQLMLRLSNPARTVMMSVLYPGPPLACTDIRSGNRGLSMKVMGYPFRRPAIDN
jgi:hypothetical protein